MKSIVAEAESLNAEVAERWHGIYTSATQQLSQYCVEQAYLDPLSDLDSGYYAVTHEFTHPIGGLIRFTLDYTHENFGHEGRRVIFAIHDTSDDEDFFVDANIATTMDEIRDSINEALFAS